MSLAKAHSLLFEPVQIGPVTAPNRLYQVPHCNGIGDAAPHVIAAMRGMKAEGGWGVVCTENLMVDAYSDIAPFAMQRLWDAGDVDVQRLTVDAIHEHGALAGCELAHFGMAASNRISRELPMGPSSRPILEAIDPRQSRVMDKSDIKAFRRRHREAAIRAREAGFDIVYLYCSHENSILSQFFSPYLNDRSDEYGGSLENRMRLFHEVLADTKDAVGDRCAVAIRFSVAQLQRHRIIERDELRDIVEATANMPDLWDVNINDWGHDSATSRFAGEGHQEDLISFVKQVSDKPVVGVGRFTSPDTMAGQVRRGVMDLVGCARPSIADPFLPEKVRTGRVDEIRECIGCNLCISGENSFTTMRCTQNPTMMEEWRRDWHPEIVSRIGSPENALIVGSGPAGLEAALVLAKRGYDVAVAEAASDFGGRIRRESALPGLAEWIRVREHRLLQLRQMANVDLYHSSLLGAEDVLDFGFENVVLATGARWRADGVGRSHYRPLDLPPVLTPDDVMDGNQVSGHVVIYDDDGSYLAAALAEQLLKQGATVEIVTPHETFARWTRLTLEQRRLRARMVERGVSVSQEFTLSDATQGQFTFVDGLTGQSVTREGDHLLMLTSRRPDSALFDALTQQPLAEAGINSVTPIGDCVAPGLIAHAVFAGHRLGREIGQAAQDVSYARERFSLNRQAAHADAAE
ncbi:Trimethylamine dehydrogenase [Falsiruegeria litorea R37]|uniref:Trimethylamine dehydrogenase n=1 Tax=Falsiruegeria litorea R37 TaxID=1200284 RepID=A0A1Y5RVC6_9RHOB|nr:FAD-dependent oxidoreductase [Falsiruegeria litorea]SLN26175.1 Trimethylamine dehydrogenase [Falsiruegeria litorea R37]